MLVVCIIKNNIISEAYEATDFESACDMAEEMINALYDEIGTSEAQMIVEDTKSISEWQQDLKDDNYYELYCQDKYGKNITVQIISTK